MKSFFTWKGVVGFVAAWLVVTAALVFICYNLGAYGLQILEQTTGLSLPAPSNEPGVMISIALICAYHAAIGVFAAFFIVFVFGRVMQGFSRFP